MFIQPRELATHLLQDLKTLSPNDKESDISAGWKCASILIFFVRLLQPISWREVYDIIKGQDVQMMIVIGACGTGMLIIYLF